MSTAAIRAAVCWAVALALLGAVAYVSHLRHAKEVAEQKAARWQSEAQAAQKALQTVKAQTAATATVDQHTAKAIAQTQQITTSNLQKVSTYVPKRSDDQCIIGVGAVSLLDAAARNVPVPAVSLPDAGSGVALSDLVADTVVNAGNYHQLAERLKAWDDWYDAQAKIAAGN